MLARVSSISLSLSLSLFLSLSLSLYTFGQPLISYFASMYASRLRPVSCFFFKRKTTGLAKSPMWAPYWPPSEDRSASCRDRSRDVAADAAARRSAAPAVSSPVSQPAASSSCPVPPVPAWPARWSLSPPSTPSSASSADFGTRSWSVVPWGKGRAQFLFVAVASGNGWSEIPFPTPASGTVCTSVDPYASDNRSALETSKTQICLG